MPINEEQFISLIKKIKEMNKTLELETYQLRGEGKAANDLTGLGKEKETYARDVLALAASNKILSTVLNGVLGTMNPAEMTSEQKQCLSAQFADGGKEFSVEEKQRLLRGGITQHGVPGDFASAPLYNEYSFDNEPDDKDTWFFKVFKGGEFNKLLETVCSTLLNVASEKVRETLDAFREGK